MNRARLRKEMERLTAQANFSLRKDVARLLQRAYVREKNKRAKNALGWIIENARIARKDTIALCQDTGLPVVFIEIGKGADISFALIKAIEDGIENGYRKNYLRPSLVDPLVRKEPGYRGVVSHIQVNQNIRGIKVSLLPKGFGSENKTTLRMFNPTVSLAAIEDFIVDSVKKAGPESCPPFVVGIGIGGTSDHALLLAKKALLAPLDRSAKDRVLKNMETRLLRKINALGLGPMGLGGLCTALAVKINTAPTHIAGLPVGVNISCHALRSATVEIG